MPNIFSSSKREASPLADFHPTDELQIQAKGYDMTQALTGNMLDNISVDRVDTNQPEYTSIRLKKNSNSCCLVRASDPSQTVLISTIYRFGPGRHPRLHILPSDVAMSVNEALEMKNDNVPGETVEVDSRKWYSRDQVFETSLGHFFWTYGDRDDRKESDADSLLVMNRTMGKETFPVAQLVRNQEHRTPGTVRYSGGNGGRLMLDLSSWASEKEGTSKNAEAFIVASCILMLKREADRFKQNAIAAVS